MLLTQHSTSASNCHMGARLKRPVVIALLLLTTLVLTTLLAAYWLVDRQKLTGHIAAALTDRSGHQIRLPEQVNVQSMFPRLKLGIPRLTSEGSLETNQRLRTRINDNSLSASSIGILFGKTDSLVVHADNIAAIVERYAQRDSSALVPDAHRSELDDVSGIQDTEADGLTRVHKKPTIQDSTTSPLKPEKLFNTVTSLDTIKFNATVESVDVVIRDTQAQSSRWSATNVTFNNDDNGELSALINGPAINGSSNTQHLVDITWELSKPASDVRLDATGQFIQRTAQNESDSAAEEPANVQLSALFTQDKTLLDAFEITGADSDTPFDGHITLGNTRGDAQGRLSIMEDVVRRMIAGSMAVSDKEDSSPRKRLLSFTPFASTIPTWLNIDTTVLFNPDSDEHPSDADVALKGELRVSTSDGTLALSSDSLSLFEGSMSFDTRWDTQQPHDTDLELTARGHGLRLDRIRPDGVALAALDRGEVDIKLALRGRGPSLGHVSSSLNGYAMLSIDSALLNRRYTTALDRGMLDWALVRAKVTF